MRSVHATLLACTLLGAGTALHAVETKAPSGDASTHLMKPVYQSSYGPLRPDEIMKTLERVRVYLEKETPARMIHGGTGETVGNLDLLDGDAVLDHGDFRIISYEWGVTYSGMLRVAELTGDEAYRKYATDRMEFIAAVLPHFETQYAGTPKSNPLRAVIAPRLLDDAGAMCMAMIKTQRHTKTDFRPMIDRWIDFIMNKEFRLEDGTLARNFPHPDTLWLDDLYMSLPALAQMGKLTGDPKYHAEVVKQLKLFAGRMFIAESGLFRHGWVQAMEPHPAFHWGRANGWAFMTMAEILDVLPTDHPGHGFVLELFRAHAAGLAKYQAASGFWHQLIDRNDSYPETSATAIFSYCYAHGINEGWLDAKAYGPAAVLGWHAVSSKVNQLGQVEGVCVGTGMGFDPAFYYHRPVSVLAAHGYGPVLLAGAEMMKLQQSRKAVMIGDAIQFQDAVKAPGLDPEKTGNP